MKISSWMMMSSGLIAFLLHVQVFADTATDTVDAKVGIYPALELVCTDISFGVWRVPARKSTATKLTMDKDKGDIMVSGNTNRIAKSNGNSSWLHERGVCVLSGSTAAKGTSIKVTLNDNNLVTFDAANFNTTGFAGLPAATVAAPGLEATLKGPDTVILGDNGSVTFYVAGELTVPGVIEKSHHGGYRAKKPVSVTVDDGV